VCLNIAFLGIARAATSRTWPHLKSTPSIAPTRLATSACSKRFRALPSGPCHPCKSLRHPPSDRPAAKEPQPPPPLNLTRASAAAPFPIERVPTRHITFADRSDVIRFDAPDEIISAAARSAHDNETLLVAGAPEAKSDDAALAAVVAFVKGRCQSNGASSTRSATCPLASDDLRCKGAPLGQCGRASLLVHLAGDEMALLIEMVVDLGVN
jgi:hypothetical protein